MKPKICHMTSAHRSMDTRIFHKECVSLAQAGYDVYLVAKGDSSECGGVHIVGIGEVSASRWKRMLETTRRVYRKALELDADLYHFHDPELMPCALRLAKRGKRVIFDSHEDYMLTIEHKPYLPRLLRPLVRWCYTRYELYACRRFAAAICCCHWTRDRLAPVCPHTELVFNFPLLAEEEAPPQEAPRENKVCFAGDIDRQWNHAVVIEAIGRESGVAYDLAGFPNQGYLDELSALPGWASVRYRGRLSLAEVQSQVYRGSLAGMALLDYIPQCLGTVGTLANTKFFEYMYAGLPLICTDFQLWKEIVDQEQCGICVNPRDAAGVAEAIRYCLDHPEEAARMGQNGRAAVLREYNWKTEEKKLLALYRRVLQTKIKDSVE